MQHERQWRGSIENFDLVDYNFDPAGSEFVVDLARRTRTHGASHAQTKFITHRFGGGECSFIVGLHHYLNQTFVIAQVDEDHATVIASGIGPAAQRNGLIDQGLVNETAVVSAHAVKLQKSRASESGAKGGRRILNGFVLHCKQNARQTAGVGVKTAKNRAVWG
jgi:hypothetical protein